MDPMKDACILAGLVVARIYDRGAEGQLDAVLLALARDILFAAGETNAEAYSEKVMTVIRDTMRDAELLG